MIALTLADLARVTGGEVHGPPDLVIDGAAYVDTRTPVAGGLFVAIAGEHVDGHDFADGAHAVLGARATSAPTVVVPDPTAALGRLARHVVDRLDARVFAMTGSQGKTGTKDYLAHVLAASGPTVATTANNNNELGVPLTALRADAATEHLVVEMGARGIGHIAYLARIAPPSVAAVLNVGTAHIGEFGGREAIAAAKGELVEALDTTGTAVLNADDPLVIAMAARTTARVLTFGAHADVSWRDLVLDDLGRARFELAHDGRRATVSLRQTGAHQVANATAAAAMALAAGMGLEQVADSLSSAESASRWRMELTERADGLLVLNDAYNANPASMRAAIDALARLGRARSGRSLAVLGEMRELGDEHLAGHLEVGRAVAEAGIDVVVVVGEGAAGIADGVRAAGGAGRPGGGSCEVIVTAGRDDATAWVGENAAAGDVVLVKASRASALEHVAEHLLRDGADRGVEHAPDHPDDHPEDQPAEAPSTPTERKRPAP